MMPPLQGQGDIWPVAALLACRIVTTIRLHSRLATDQISPCHGLIRYGSGPSFDFEDGSGARPDDNRRRRRSEPDVDAHRGNPPIPGGHILRVPAAPEFRFLLILMGDREEADAGIDALPDRPVSGQPT